MGAQRSNSLVILATVLAGFLLPGAAGAAVTAANSTPARVAVAATGPATVTVSWRLLRLVLDPPNPASITSGKLRILIDGDLAASLPRSLTTTAPGLSLSETVEIRETLQIPEALIYRAIKQGGVLQVTRDFVDSSDGIGSTAELQVTPSGPGSAAFAIERLELRFDDDSRTRVLPRGDQLRVVAEVNYAGSGLLSGVWEIASPASTAADPAFRPLALVRQGVSSGGRTVITSPLLPTLEEGTSLVRFRLTEPVTDFAAPQLQYYVTPRNPVQQAAPQRNIIVTAPRPGAPLTAETVFAWQAVEGAEAYLITFYALPAGPVAPAEPAGTAVAGLFVPGTQTEAKAAGFTLAVLPSGGSYLWKVTAIDANGAVIGSSSTREAAKP